MWVQVPPSVQRVPGAIWQTRIVQADVFQGSSPWEPTNMGIWRNRLAQLTVNQEVEGSSPSIPANGLVMELEYMHHSK